MTKRYIEVDQAVLLAIECCRFHVPYPPALGFDRTFEEIAKTLSELNEQQENEFLVKKGRAKPIRADCQI